MDAGEPERLAGEWMKYSVSQCPRNPGSRGVSFKVT
jgi:hypothetical protein